MGKPFANELKLLPASFKWAASLAIAPLQNFIAQAQGNLLVAIGAGGSFTTVELARLLHEQRGGTALAHTPLSFIQSKTDLRNAYVVIFTASGNNRDVLATYEAASSASPRASSSSAAERAPRSKRNRRAANAPSSSQSGCPPARTATSPRIRSRRFVR